MKRILFWILVVILISFTCCSLVNADNFDQNTTFTPTLSNVTYNLTRYLGDCNITCHGWCLNITGGPEEHNYCNTSATHTTIQILAPPVIDSYEPLLDPTISENADGYEFNLTWHDVDGNANVDWYVNSSNQTVYWNLTTYNYIPNMSSNGTYNVTVIVSDNNGSDSYEWFMTVLNFEMGYGDIYSIPLDEKRCTAIGGDWLETESGKFYCQIPEEKVNWIIKVGRAIWPSHPLLAVGGLCILLYLLAVTFWGAQKYLIFFRKKEEDEPWKKEEE